MSRNRARPKNSARSQSRATRLQRQSENKMHGLIQDLLNYEEFKTKILPAIQADLKAGMSAPELRKKYAAMVQARVITEALLNPQAAVATAAAKDVIDRSEGKATERREVKHTLESLNDDELDAVLESEIADLEDMEQRFEQ